MITHARTHAPHKAKSPWLRRVEKESTLCATLAAPRWPKMDEHKEVVKDHYNRHVKNVSTAEVRVWGMQ